MSTERRQDLLYPPGPRPDQERDENRRPPEPVLGPSQWLHFQLQPIRHNEAALEAALRRLSPLDRLNARLVLSQLFGGHYFGGNERAVKLCERVFGPGAVEFPEERRWKEEQQRRVEQTSKAPSSPDPHKVYEDERIAIVSQRLMRMVDAGALPAGEELVTLLRSLEERVAQQALWRLYGTPLPGRSEVVKGYFQPVREAGGEEVSRCLATRASPRGRPLGEAPPVLLETRVLGAAGGPGGRPMGGVLLGSWDEAASKEARAERNAQVDEALGAGHPALAGLDQGGGEPLDEALRARMERLLGHDFAHVRIHTDAAAAEAARLLGARALALGTHIYFGAGQWAPGTTSGDRLLVHELVHVVQFDVGRLPSSGLGQRVSRPEDAAEREAERTASDLQSAAPHAAGLVHAGFVAAPTRASQGAATPGFVLRDGPGPDPNYLALCEQIQKGLASTGSRDKLYAALAQLSSPVQLPKLLAAWNLVSPRVSLFQRLKAELDDAAQAQVWERLMGQSVVHGEMAGTTTTTYYNLRSQAGTTGEILGQLLGRPMHVRVVGKAHANNKTWYLLEFASADEYSQVARLPEKPSAETRALYHARRAWAVELAVTSHVSYTGFLAQLRNFEMIHSDLSLTERITLLRQMAHPSNLPFDTVIGTATGSSYEDQRPDLTTFYQMLKDAKAIKTPSGEIIDIYHFIVGLDVYQKGRIGQERFKFIRLGQSDPSATWAGDIGAGAADALLRKDKDWEENNPGISEEERVDHYYSTRAPTSDLLADIDAWSTVEQVEQGDAGDTISALVESVYGPGRATNRGTPMKRRLAIQRFLDRHGLTASGGSILSDPNRAILKYFIQDFGRVWIYRAQLSTSFWFGSSYDKGGLANISEKMADKFLRWLDTLAKAEGAL